MMGGANSVFLDREDSVGSSTLTESGHAEAAGDAGTAEEAGAFKRLRGNVLMMGGYRGSKCFLDHGDEAAQEMLRAISALIRYLA